MQQVEISAYDLCVAVLDINETIEKLKEMNTDNQPNLTMCTAVELLTDYRDICTRLLKRTEVF